MVVQSTAITGLLLISVTAFSAPSDSLKLSIGLFYENSDNVHHVPRNEISENIVHTLFSASYIKEAATYSANFNLNVDYANYLKDAFPDQTVASSLFNMTAILLKRRLFWDFYNKYDKVQTDYTLADIPTNLENTNFFRMGPRFVFFKNTKQSWDADLNYINFYTEKSNSDYNGYKFNTTYLRNITHTFALSLNASHADRRYTYAPASDNYQKTDLIVGLSKQTKLSSSSIQLGKTHINTSSANIYDDSIFRVYYKYLGNVNINISYRREIDDFSAQYANATSDTSSGILPSVSNSLFLLREGQFSAIKQFDRSSLGYSYIYFSSDYEDVTLNSVRKTNQINYIYKLTSSVSMNTSGIYAEYDFLGIGRSDIVRIYAIDFSKKFLGAYDIGFNVQYTNRGSTDSDFTYKERRVGLIGNYHF